MGLMNWIRKHNKYDISAGKTLYCSYGKGMINRRIIESVDYNKDSILIKFKK